MSAAAKRRVVSSYAVAAGRMLLIQRSVQVSSRYPIPSRYRRETGKNFRRDSLCVSTVQRALVARRRMP